MSLDGLRANVAEMEARLLGRDDRLRRAYERAAARFHEDLAEERDALLARGAALMLIEQLVRDDV
jgi:hypothetical protein